MDFIKSAAATAGIGALGITSYAITQCAVGIASPMLIPVGAAMVFIGGLGWLYQRAHRESSSI